MIPNVGEGTLSFVIWPAYAGAVNEHGNEPISNPDYQRGQIIWGITAQDQILGHTRIHLPAGTWTHIVYTHHPSEPLVITASKLLHPIVLHEAGYLDITDITEEDVRPLQPDAVLHD